MKNKKVIFLKYSLLEEIETSKKGEVSSNQILSLINNKKYKLEEAIIFKEKLEGNPKKNLIGKIITNSELKENGYDLYMNTVIIEDCVYQISEGFKGTLIEDSVTPKIIDKTKPIKKDFPKEEKTSEQLLADLMLGF